MKIYISHSKDFDFQNELYQPIRTSALNTDHEITLPHEDSNSRHFNSKEYLPQCDLMIAEVSYPTTGTGIELGWADAFEIPIICLHKKDVKPPGSTRVVCKKFIEYDSAKELIDKISSEIKK
ncbi:hypothetical protein ACFL0Z_01450 [Patescibacteria group bacterium]